MSPAKTLEKNLASLAAKWADAADAAYPFATAGFLRSQGDPFANPIGRRSRDLAEILFRAVLGLPYDDRRLRSALEEFARVRAMQDAEAETSLAVMFACKDIIRACLEEHSIPAASVAEGLRAMDERCDSAALLAFGFYARAREAFYNARIEDYRRRNSQIMRLAKLHGLAVEDTADPGGNPGDR